MKKAIFMPVVLLSATFIAHTASAEMYKWTDKSGETHYTQTPPPADAQGKDIEDEIRLSTGKLGNTIPEQANKGKPEDEMDKAREEGEKSDQKHRDFCAQQADALKQMTANALIKWKDAEGERFLTAEEKASKMQEMEKNINSMCKPEMFSKKDGAAAGSQTEKAVDARYANETSRTNEISNNTSPQGTGDAANGASSTGATEGGTPTATSMLPATD